MVISPWWRTPSTRAAKCPGRPAACASASAMASPGITKVTARPGDMRPLSRTRSRRAGSPVAAPPQRSQPQPGSWPSPPSHQPVQRLAMPTRSATRAVRGARCTNSGVPLCSTWPASMTTRRSASRRASFRSCVTSTIGTASSRRRSAISRYRPWRAIMSTAEKGSSSSSSIGARASARATATRCCWPPESCAGRRCTSSPVSPTWASQRAASRSRSARGRCSSDSATLPAALRCGISA